MRDGEDDLVGLVQLKSRAYHGNRGEGINSRALTAGVGNCVS